MRCLFSANEQRLHELDAENECLEGGANDVSFYEEVLFNVAALSLLQTTKVANENQGKHDRAKLTKLATIRGAAFVSSSLRKIRDLFRFFLFRSKTRRVGAVNTIPLVKLPKCNAG